MALFEMVCKEYEDVLLSCSQSLIVIAAVIPQHTLPIMVYAFAVLISLYAQTSVTRYDFDCIESQLAVISTLYTVNAAGAIRCSNRLPLSPPPPPAAGNHNAK